jgi:hypothetical protein
MSGSRECTERFPDAHRQLLVVLVTQAWVRIQDDPKMRDARKELLDIRRRLEGTDTRVIVERAYPSGVIDD